MDFGSVGTPVGVHQRLMRHADTLTTLNTYGDVFTPDMAEAQNKKFDNALSGTGSSVTCWFLVDAVGLESTIKRIFNNMQVSG
jgi:hypothetical protein